MEKMCGMSGFFVAAVTPYDTLGRVHPTALHKLMDRTVAQGATGFLIGGSSAECPLLSRKERETCLDAAANFSDRAKTKLIASVAAISTEEAVSYAKLAQSLGYDAIISTPPYYYKFGMKQIADYFTTLKNATAMPLLLYNFPGNTNVEIDISDPSISAILTDGTLAGVKQTSLNLYQMERMHAMNPALMLYGGYDEVYLGARILGADGAIGSTFNFTLPLFQKIEKAYQARDLTAALALQTRANHIMQALVSCSLFPSIKHILRTQGIDCGEARAPFPSLTDEQKAYIERIVAQNL